jgi:tetratricopeptide (TPR) repeat protein
MRLAQSRTRALTALAALGGLALGACRAQPQVEEPPAAVADPVASLEPGPASPSPAASAEIAAAPASDGSAAEFSASFDEETREAQAALAAGDIVGARAALEALLTKQLLASCEKLLRAGRVEDALKATEAALAESPSLTSALYLNGACLAVLADRSGDERLFTEALETLSRPRECGPSLVAASRVARRLGRHEQALELARAGASLGTGAFSDVQRVAELAASGGVAPLPVESADRALAEAALAVWRERGGVRGEGNEALFDEAEEALSHSLLARDDDPWTWRTLGAAYLEAGRAAEAQASLENGLDQLPLDEGLFDLLARAARESRGTPEVVRVFKRVQAKRPQVALSWWYPARELFRAGLEREGAWREHFRDAEAAFRTCRAKDPNWEGPCRRFEVLCRTGQGWGWLAAGNLDAAWNSFRSTLELLDVGLELSLLDVGMDASESGELLTAAAGLQRLIELHLSSTSELERAVRAAELLRSSSPLDVVYARQAGNLQRELGDRLQLLSDDLRSAARKGIRDAARLEELRAQIGVVRPGDDLRGTPRERDRFFQLGERHRRGAQEAYQASLTAYRQALALSPADLRLGCDAATIAVHRLEGEVDWAQAELRRLIELGRVQLEADRFASDEERYAVKEAWGDAHELMGILLLERRDDPRGARGWFEKSLTIGPDRRPEIDDYYLPLCAQREQRKP